MSSSNNKETKRRIRNAHLLQSVILIAELGDFGNDLYYLFYVSSLRGEDEPEVFTDTENVVYLLVLVIALLASLYAIFNILRVWINLHSISNKGLSENNRLFRKNRDKQSSVVQSEQHLITMEKSNNDEVSLEFELLRVRQNISHYRVISILGLIEDMPLFWVLLYLLFNSNPIIDNASCSEWSVVYNYRVWPLFRQLLITSMCLVFKLSHFRDLRREYAVFEKLEHAFKRKVKNSQSMLDDFQGVTEDEIYQVLKLRNSFINSFEDKNKAHSTISDVRVLCILRYNGYDEIKSLQHMREWIGFREVYGCDKIRNEIIAKDFPFNNLPSLLSSIFSGNLMKKSFDKVNNSLVLYIDTTSIDKDALGRLSDEEILEYFIYDAEYLDVVLEYLSCKHRSIVSLTILTEENCPLKEDKSEPELNGLNILRNCPQYPHFLSMIAYVPPDNSLTPFEWLEFISSKDTVVALDYESKPDLYLSRRLFPKFYGVHEQKRRASIWNIEQSPSDSKVVPLEEDTRRSSQPLSYLTATNLDLMSFIDVTDEEISYVSDLLEQIKTKIGTAKYETLSESFAGNVNLLRLLQSCGNNVSSAVSKFMYLLKKREEYGVDEINSRIRNENMSLEALPNWNSFISARPGGGIFNRTGEGNIVYHSTILRYFDFEKHKLCFNEILDGFLWMNEYFSIVIDSVSRSEKRMVSLLHFYDISGFNALETKAWFSKVCNLEDENPKCLDVSSMFEVNFCSNVTIYGIADTAGRKIRSSLTQCIRKHIRGTKQLNFTIFEDSSIGKQRLRLSLRLFEILSHSKEGLINKTFPKLQDLLSNMTSSGFSTVPLEIDEFSNVTGEEVQMVRQLKEDLICCLGSKTVGDQPESFLGSVCLLRALRNHDLRKDLCFEYILEGVKLRTKHKLNEINQAITRENLSLKDFPHFRELNKLGMIHALHGKFHRDKNGNILNLAGVLRYIDLEAVFRRMKIDAMKAHGIGSTKGGPGEDQSFYESNKLYQSYYLEYIALLVDELSRMEKRIVSYTEIIDVSGISLSDFRNRKTIYSVAPREGDLNHDFFKKSYFGKCKEILYGTPKGAGTGRNSNFGTTISFPDKKDSRDRFQERFGLDILKLGFDESKERLENLEHNEYTETSRSLLLETNQRGAVTRRTIVTKLTA